MKVWSSLRLLLDWRSTAISESKPKESDFLILRSIQKVDMFSDTLMSEWSDRELSHLKCFRTRSISLANPIWDKSTSVWRVGFEWKDSFQVLQIALEVAIPWGRRKEISWENISGGSATIGSFRGGEMDATLPSVSLLIFITNWRGKRLRVKKRREKDSLWGRNIFDERTPREKENICFSCRMGDGTESKIYPIRESFSWTRSWIVMIRREWDGQERRKKKVWVFAELLL